MLKISYAGCFGLSLAILAQFTLEMRVAAQNRDNLLKPAILGVRDHSRSFMLTFLRSSTPVLVIITAYLCLSATIFTLDEPIAVK